MKKLRIAMFMSSHPGKAGGVQEHVYYLSKELRVLGHRIDIFGPESHNNRFINYHTMGDKYVIPLPASHEGSVHLLRNSDEPEKIFSPKNYDILHMHEPYQPFAGWTVLEKATAPIVSTFHTTWDDRSIINIFNGLVPLFKEQFSHHSRGAIFVSQKTYDKWGEICDDTVYKQIIPNAVDTTLFTPKKGPVNAPIQFLFAARIVQRKGLFKLLNALSILQKKKIPFHLTIMGDGEDRRNSLDYIKNNNLSSHVTYVGEILGEDRARYYSRADVFCAPYVNDAAPISLLEAISSGLPIVGFKDSIFSDFLKDYPADNLLVDTDPKILASAIEKIIRNPSIIPEIKKWCLAKRTEFSWKNIATKTEEVYARILT